MGIFSFAQVPLHMHICTTILNTAHRHTEMTVNSITFHLIYVFNFFIAKAELLAYAPQQLHQNNYGLRESYF